MSNAQKGINIYQIVTKNSQKCNIFNNTLRWLTRGQPLRYQERFKMFRGAHIFYELGNGLEKDAKTNGKGKKMFETKNCLITKVLIVNYIKKWSGGGFILKYEAIVH